MKLLPAGADPRVGEGLGGITRSFTAIEFLMD